MYILKPYMNFSKLTFFLFILSINSSDAVCKTPDSTFNVVGDFGQTCSDACSACGATDNTAANIGNMDSAVASVAAPVHTQ